MNKSYRNIFEIFALFSKLSLKNEFLGALNVKNREDSTTSLLCYIILVLYPTYATSPHVLNSNFIHNCAWIITRKVIFKGYGYESFQFHEQKKKMDHWQFLTNFYLPSFFSGYKACKTPLKFLSYYDMYESYRNTEFSEEKK